MKISTEVISSFIAFGALKSEWNAVLSRSRYNDFFVTWQWLYSWWQTYHKKTDRLFIIVVRQDEQIIGIAPLMIRKIKYYGYPRNTVCFIGEGNSDHSNVLVLRKPEIVLRKICSQLKKAEGLWDIVSLRELPADSELINSIREYIPWTHVDEDSSCPYISIDTYTTWDLFAKKTISRNLKRDYKNKLNRLKKLGPFKFNHTILKDSVPEILADVKNVEVQSAKAMKMIALVFDPEKNLRFQNHVIEKTNHTLQAILSTLHLNDQLIAYLYGFIYDNKYYAYNTAYLPEYRKISPGKLLMNETIKFVVERKLREFDFLRGASYLKSKYATDDRHQIKLAAYRSTLPNALLRFVAYRIKPTVKPIFKRIYSSVIKAT